jgi:hypothetical protein
MIKRLVIGGLIVALVGVLGVGIYSYTQNDSSLRAGQAFAQGLSDGQGYRGGQSNDISPLGYEGEGRQGNSGGRSQGNAAPGNGRSAGNQVPAPAGQDRNLARGYSDGTGVPDPQADVSQWFTLNGEVLSLDVTSLTLYTDDGQTLDIQLGPEWFWTSQDAPLAPGEQVTVQAFEENGQIQAGQISLDGDGTTLALRDASGRPLWAGGRGGGRP